MTFISCMLDKFHKVTLLCFDHLVCSIDSLARLIQYFTDDYILKHRPSPRWQISHSYRHPPSAIVRKHCRGWNGQDHLHTILIHPSIHISWGFLYIPQFFTHQVFSHDTDLLNCQLQTVLMECTRHREGKSHALDHCLNGDMYRREESWQLL